MKAETTMNPDFEKKFTAMRDRVKSSKSGIMIPAGTTREQFKATVFNSQTKTTDENQTNDF